MKIVGLTYYDGNYRMAMKSDSSLLQGRQPFFVPDWCEEVVALPCTAVRISRMGRHIEKRFASRYYDAIALALDFRADDMLRQGRWAEGMAFDQAFVLGEWTNADLFPKQQLPDNPAIDEVVEQVSAKMIVRTGDILFIDQSTKPQRVEKGQEYTLYIKQTDKETQETTDKVNLYCRIK